MHPEMPSPISSTAEIEHLKADPKNKGKTYEVTREVFKHFTKDLKAKPVTKKELAQINRLLSAKIPDSKRPALTRTCACPNCHHEFRFSDFVSSALAQSAHSTDQLRGFFTGPRCWLTIDTDATRTLRCSKCSHEFPGVFCCYVTDDYAYV